jgi:glycosyltransferase involved in cell wall biosynthesis
LTRDDADGGLGVALLTPVFWPEVRRGGERLVRGLADGLLDRGHAPVLVTSHSGRPRRTVEDGLPVVRTWRPPVGVLSRRGFEDHLGHLPATSLALRRGDFDVAHAFYPGDGAVAARWAGRTRRPAVMTWLGAPTRKWLVGRRRRLDLSLAAVRGCTTIAISRAAADAFARWLGVDVRVIHPGVDLNAFAPTAERAPEPTIVCAAALDQPQKRVPLLLEAFEIVRRSRPGARLVLSRPSGARQPIGLADAAGVEVRDLDDPEVLMRAYAEGWVSALPSVGEAFGLVLVESLACGTPVVGTREGGIPEIFDRPGIGSLFDGDDPKSLAAALLETIELATDPATRARCRARAEDFSLDRTVAAYVRLYRELLEARA